MSNFLKKRKYIYSRSSDLKKIWTPLLNSMMGRSLFAPLSRQGSKNLLGSEYIKDKIINVK